VVSVVSIATRPRVGRSGVRIPVGASDCSVLQGVMTGCGAHPACFQWVAVSFPGVKRPGVKLTSHHRPLLRLRMSGAVPLLPLYTIKTWTG